MQTFLIPNCEVPVWSNIIIYYSYSKVNISSKLQLWIFYRMPFHVDQIKHLLCGKPQTVLVSGRKLHHTKVSELLTTTKT